jgi:hypothetical protein
MIGIPEKNYNSKEWFLWYRVKYLTCVVLKISNAYVMWRMTFFAPIWEQNTIVEITNYRINKERECLKNNFR